MATSAGTSVTLNGPSAGAVSGGKTLYDTEDTSSNQENQAPRNYGSSSSNLRQRSTSNLRAPLSPVPSGHKGANDQIRPTNHRVSELGQDHTIKRGSSGENTGKLYKNNDSSGNLSASEQYDDIPENMYKPGKEDREGWIHREKLAKIENEELQAAGINLAKARSKSRDALSGRTRENSRDRLRDLNSREEKRARIESPVPEQVDGSNEQEHWDLRTPEEILNDSVTDRYTNPLLRKHGSKIPVMTTSSTPISSDRYERETPMPRKRTMSGSISPDDSLLVGKTRNVTAEPEATSSSKSSSPTKSRSKSIATSKPEVIVEPKTPQGPRKVSAPVKAAQTSPTRPTTRGNDAERPRTAAGRPEGDPPWLATMYKPDPMLPPDQQLIPTLAKKKQQEMWEAHGEIPSTYDRQFSALTVHGTDGPVRESSQERKPEPHNVELNKDQQESWPLKKVPTSKSPPPPLTRPTTSSGTGGYSTMPRVQSPPIGISASPRLGHPNSPHIGAPQSPVVGSASHQNDQPQRGPSSARQNGQGRNDVHRPPRQPVNKDEDDEKVEKKGCCCIVM